MLIKENYSMNMINSFVIRQSILDCLNLWGKYFMKGRSII